MSTAYTIRNLIVPEHDCLQRRDAGFFDELTRRMLYRVCGSS